MANHRVQGVPVLPGMGVLALLARAAREQGFDGPLEEIAWIRPIAAPTAVRVTSSLEGDELALRLVDAKGQACARATARREAVAAPPDLDRAMLTARTGRPIEPAAVRSFLEQAGIEHGRGFRLLAGIDLHEGWLLARLEPGRPEAWAPLEEGPVSPAALDSALQALAAHACGVVSGVVGDGRPLLPAGVGRFVCHWPMEGELIAWIEVDPAATDDARLTADLLLARPGGEVVAELRGFVARRLERALDAQAGDAGGVVYLRPFWEPKPVPARAGQPPLVLHTPGAGTWAAVMAQETGGRALAAEALDPAQLSALLSDGAASVVFAAWDEVPRQALELAGPDLAVVERDAVWPMHALLQALARSGSACRLTLVTRGLAAVPGEAAMAPAYAALPGLVLTAGRELARLEVAHVDLPLAAPEEKERAHRSWILGEAGGGAVVAYRGPQRLVRALETVVLDEGTTGTALGGLPERAACLIVGGAGGLGRALSLHLAQKLRARIAWIGRSAEDERVRSAREAVAAAGGEVVYRQLDAADEAGLRDVVAELRERWGGIDLAVHSALVLADRSLAQMTTAELDAALRPKTHGLIALARALADGPAPRLCAFSSANAFTLNPGQANYAAGSTFADAYVLALARSAGWRATILNWGIWGETGIVAQESFIERARREGILSLSTAEGMRAFDLAMARSLDQAMVLKVAAEHRAGFEGAQAAQATRVDAEAVLDMAGGVAALAEGHGGATAVDMTEAAVGMTALVQHARRGLARVYEGLGLWDAAPAGIDAMADRLGIVPARRPLLEAHLEILARVGWLRLEPGLDGPVVYPMPEVRGEAEPEEALPPGPLALLEAAIAGTAELLRGRREATDILFPGGSTHLVDAVYAGDQAVDFFNGLVAAAVRGLAGDRPLRILEIGAGTGATTRRVLEALEEGRIERYHVTDISPRLVAQARETLGRYPAARFATFDVTRDPCEAGFEEGGFDIVIAANVLHATPQLAGTLRNAKRLLRRGGALILNEATAASDFATLTFGLTDGWWAFEDAWLRLPHAPLLSAERWQTLLAVEGFSPMATGGLEGGGQHVILARSDGWLRRAGQTPAVAAAQERPAEPSVMTAAASQGTGSALDIARETLARTLKLEPHRIDAEAPLERYGVDSLVAGELQARLEEIYGSLPRTLVFEARSLAELAAALSTRAVQRPVAPAPVPATAPVAAVPAHDDAIAIIGLAGRYPGAGTVEALWDNLEAGRSAITDVPADRAAFRSLRAEEAALGRGGFLADVAGFDPLLFGISPAEAATMDPQERLFLETVWAGLENAGRLPEAWDREVGVFVGVMGTDYGRLAAEEAARGGPGLGSSAFWSIANRVSHVLDLTGPSLAVDTACSASLAAIHLAAESLRRGECRAAIAGGVHLILHPASRRGLLALGLQSPTGEARAFAEDADGLVGGEGVGCLVLRRLEDAIRDKDRILGRGPRDAHGGQRARPRLYGAQCGRSG